MDKPSERRCSFALIDSLCVELSEVKVMQHPMKRVLPWLVLGVLYLIASVSYFDLRADIHLKLLQPHYWLELILIAGMAVTAALCSAWLCVPDMSGQRWMLAVPLTLLSVFLVWKGLRLALEDFAMPAAPWHICFFQAFVFGVIPGIMIFLLSARGRTTQPNMLCLMNALAFGGLGYIGLRLTTGAEDVGYTCVSQILPMILLCLTASLLARRLYRW